MQVKASTLALEMLYIYICAYMCIYTHMYIYENIQLLQNSVSKDLFIFIWICIHSTKIGHF